jgi:uncharacterized cofD-like protein
MMMVLSLQIKKWLTIGIGLKRWLVLFLVGIVLCALGLSLAILQANPSFSLIAPVSTTAQLLGLASVSFLVAVISLYKFLQNLLAPYRRMQHGNVIDVMVEHTKRQKGLKLVAIGGGTGLPATLRGMKHHTGNITAIVTVADDGGSSGRLRREMGVLPPGDLRNNIAALADDESLMTRLFQFRFESGDMQGHAFGNLFIAALSNIVEKNTGNRNSLAEALIEAERVLNIRGRVLPATLDDVRLAGIMRLKDSDTRVRIVGESQFETIDGKLEQIELDPPNAEAYAPSIEAIMNADMVVIGPGSLYTSILPNLMVSGIADALRATKAYKVYVCNVATQPVETEAYSVAEHVMALEDHIGRGVFQAVLANNCYPKENAGQNTSYVPPAPSNHEILQRYEVRYTDLTDVERPWRHDPTKLAQAILGLNPSTN